MTNQSNQKPQLFKKTNVCKNGWVEHLCFKDEQLRILHREDFPAKFYVDNQGRCVQEFWYLIWSKRM